MRVVKLFAATAMSLSAMIYPLTTVAQDIDSVRVGDAASIAVAEQSMATSVSMQSTGAAMSTPVGDFGQVIVAAVDAKAKPQNQEPRKEKKKVDLGRLSGSFETNTIYYVNDPQVGSTAPDPPVGSHNYLKLDYTNGKFAVGLQAEYNPFVLQGYQPEMQGFGIPEKYISWTDDWFSVLVGDFYEQFGSGLILRAWEDRQLGFNNSIGGARVTFNVKDILNVKLIYGFPRDYLHSVGQKYDLAGSVFNDYSPSQLGGLDVHLSLSRLFFPTSDHDLYVEGSFVDRFERFAPSGGELNGLVVPNHVMSYSARFGYSYKGFSVSGEYVGRGKDLYTNPQTSTYELKAGNAQLLEVHYAGHGLSVSGSFRRLSNMQSVVYHNGVNMPLPGNTMNYLPSLTLQQSYMLASHNPYNTFANGEIGGQLDVFYSFKRGSAIGGKYGMKIHANASLFYATAEALHNASGDRLAYRDITIDLEKNWTKKFKTIFFVSIQENSPSHGEGVTTEAQNIFVIDMQYKFTPKFSLRAELQYLYSEERTRDWVAALLEVNFSPNWSIYASDMYNHGSSKVHYYSVGASFTHGIWRVAANWGRNREGMVCSGGVCRWQPAYTGANLQLSIVF